jgi:hypothetical protein
MPQLEDNGPTLTAASNPREKADKYLAANKIPEIFQVQPMKYAARICACMYFDGKSNDGQCLNECNSHDD